MQILGIATIAVAAAGYSYSWRLQSKNSYKVAVLLLVIVGAVLRIYTASDLFLHPWDERYHALVAKNLIQHPFMPTLYDNPLLPYDLKNWPANHIWLHKQPLPLWSMAASMSLFGVNEIALRLPSILLSTAGIWLAYIIGTFFCDRRCGFLTAFFFSINGLIIELTGGRVATDHIDVFFLFFVELAVVLSILYVQRRKTIFNVLAGISLGAAILSKWLPALVVIPIWLLLVLDSKSFKPRVLFFQFLILLSTSLIIFLPWQVYIHHTFPLEAAWEADYNFRHFTEVVEGRTGPIYYFIDRIRINYGELIYLPLGWYLWKTIRNPGDLKRMAIVIWFLIPFFFFSVAKTKMQGYLLFTSPALFLMTSEFFLMIVNYRNQHGRKWIFNVLLILLIALPARYMIERVKPFQTTERRLQWITDVKSLDQEMTEQGVLFNFNKPVEAMFYTDLVVYRQIPTLEVLSELTGEGYRIIINDDGKLPEKISTLREVMFVHIDCGQAE